MAAAVGNYTLNVQIPTFSQTVGNTFREIGRDSSALYEISKLAYAILSAIQGPTGDAVEPFSNFKDFFGGFSIIDRINELTHPEKRRDWIGFKLADRVCLVVAHIFGFVVFANKIKEFLPYVSASIGVSCLTHASMKLTKNIFVIGSALFSIAHSIHQLFLHKSATKVTQWQERLNTFGGGDAADGSQVPLSVLRNLYQGKIDEARELEVTAPGDSVTVQKVAQIPRWEEYVQKAQNGTFRDEYRTICERKVQYYNAKAKAEFAVNLINIIYQVCKIAVVVWIQVAAPGGLAFAIVSVSMGATSVIKWGSKIVKENITHKYTQTNQQ